MSYGRHIEAARSVQEAAVRGACLAANPNSQGVAHVASGLTLLFQSNYGAIMTGRI